MTVSYCMTGGFQVDSTVGNEYSKGGWRWIDNAGRGVLERLLELNLERAGDSFVLE